MPESSKGSGIETRPPEVLLCLAQQNLGKIAADSAKRALADAYNAAEERQRLETESKATEIQTVLVDMTPRTKHTMPSGILWI